MKSTFFGERDNKGILGKSLMQDFTQGLVLAEFFEISEKAREGGMGDVFFCRDKRDNKFYVLKTYKKANSSFENFFKEAELVLKLKKHPHVVYAKTIITDADNYYIVMEYVGKQPYTIDDPVQGETLARVMDKVKIEPKQALIWAVQFCQGMQFLHQAGVETHKDIKPDNILITPENNIKIADFGLAGLDKKGGTIGYRAPEYFKEGEKLTIQSDIYSFGLVLYQMLNGGKSLPNATIWDEKTKEYEKIDINSIQSKHCLEIIKKCLVEKPEERYEKFKEIEKELRKYLKATFPEYQFEDQKIEEMTANDWFLKGLGLFLLANRSAWGIKRKETLSLSEKFFKKCVLINPKHAPAHYYISEIMNEKKPFLKMSAYSKNHIEMLKEAGVKIKDFLKEQKKAQENSDFYANIIEIENWKVFQTNDGPGYNNPSPRNLLINLRKYSKKYPKNPFLHNNLGFALVKNGNYKLAINEFSKAIKLLPDYAKAYANRAIAYLQQKEEKKALLDCVHYTNLMQTRNLLNYQVLCHGIYADILRYYCKNGKYDKAYSWYKKHLLSVREINTTQQEYLLDNAYVYIESQRLFSLIAKNSKKENLTICRKIWEKYRKNQNFKKTEKTTKSLKLVKYSVQSLSLTGRGLFFDLEKFLYLRTMLKTPKASVANERGCEIALWKYPFFPDIADSDPCSEKALPFFDLAINLDKSYAPAYYNRARAYMELRKYQNAIEDLTMAIKLAPDQIWTFELRSGHYLQALYERIQANRATYLKKKDRIIRSSYPEGVWQNIDSSHGYMKKVCLEKKEEQIFPYDPFLVKAEVYMLTGKYEKALICIEEAEKLGANIEMQHKGECFYKLGDYQRALDCFQRETSEIVYFMNVGSYDQNLCEGLSCLNIALCYAELGDNEKETEYLKRGIEYLLSYYKHMDMWDMSKAQSLTVNLKNYYKECLKKKEIFKLWPDLHFYQDSTGYIDNAYLQRANAYYALGNGELALKNYKMAFWGDNIFPTSLFLGDEYVERIVRLEEMKKQKDENDDF